MRKDRNDKGVTIKQLNQACRVAYDNLYRSHGAPQKEGEAVKEWRRLYHFIYNNLADITALITRNKNVFFFIKRYTDTLEAISRKKPIIEIRRTGAAEGLIRILDENNKTKYGSRVVNHVDTLATFGITPKTPGFYILMCLFSWEQDNLDQVIAYMDYNVVKLEKHLTATANDRDSAV